MDGSKKVHFAVGTRHFIRFDGKLKMIIEVFAYKSAEEMKISSDKITADMAALELPFLASMTAWDGLFHLLVATQFPDGVPEISTQKKADQYARTMRKLADWYRYVVLKAQAN